MRDEFVAAAPRQVAGVVNVSVDRSRHQAIRLHVVHADVAADRSKLDRPSLQAAAR